MSDSARHPKAAILTPGCKLNIADFEAAMSRRLRAAGWQVSDRANAADAVIVNSCSPNRLQNQLTPARVIEARDDHLWAEVLP